MTKPKSPPRVYSARDRQEAARILRDAQRILSEGGNPFPALEAARRARIRTDSRVWELVNQAREAVGGQRDALQLESAATLIEKDKAPSKTASPKLTRVPRCRLRLTGGRCGRPIAHGSGCSIEPPPDDLVRSIGTDHVLVGGPPTDTMMIVAWEEGPADRALRVRRDDHDRGLWIDFPSKQRRKSGELLLLGWAEIRRLVLDLNLELADRRTSR
jgi:hypothetical protein